MYLHPQRLHASRNDQDRQGSLLRRSRSVARPHCAGCRLLARHALSAEGRLLVRAKRRPGAADVGRTV